MRSRPTEDEEFPVYDVKAKCPGCGRGGQTKSLIQYPAGKTISALCTACVGRHEKTVRLFESKGLENTLKSRRRQQTKKDERNLAIGEPDVHWMDRYDNK